MVPEVILETTLREETSSWKGTQGQAVWVLVTLFLDLHAGSQGKTSLSCTLRIGVLFCTRVIRWYKVDNKKTYTQNTFKAESLCEGKEIHENCLANPILLNNSEMYSFQLFRLENLLF